MNKILDTDNFFVIHHYIRIGARNISGQMPFYTLNVGGSAVGIVDYTARQRQKEILRIDPVLIFKE